MKKLQKLWQKASSFLHYSRVEFYTEGAEEEFIRKFLSEFDNFAQPALEGNLILSMVPETVSFDCKCGMKIKRNGETLIDGLIIGCPNPECRETYNCRAQEGSFSFAAREHSVECPNCKEAFWVPAKWFDELRGDQHIQWVCKCGQTGRFRAKHIIEIPKKLSDTEG